MTPSPLCARAELRATLKLAGPIVLNQVGHMSMGLVDTLVAGRLGTNALAGLGLAANFYWTFTSVCLGALLALDTYFSQAVGARDEETVQQYLRQSFWSCVAVTGLAAIGVLAGTGIYFVFATPSPTRNAFGQYVLTIIWCLPAVFLYFVLQRYWQARHRVVAFAWMILAANVLNLALCLALGLGYWGFPRLEVQGIAFATVISRYAMLGGAVVFTWYMLKPVRLRVPRPDAVLQRRIFNLGIPAAGHTALEVSAFTIATFVVGVLGPAPLAAHHVCLMMAAFTFMFPLGFGAAAAVRVGMFIGAGEPERARLAGKICILISVVVMSGFAVIYVAVPRLLLAWFSSDPEVMEIGVRILMLVALFQIADGTQVSTTGALRGLGNTRSAMYANLIGHYPIGLALGLILCFGMGLGVIGVWAGLAAGLVSVAIILVRIWFRSTRDPSKFRAIATGHAED